MATIKHISSKNADYGAAEAYLTFEHDEFTMKPTLDEAGRLIPRQDYRLDTLNCGEEDFALSCIVNDLIDQQLNDYPDEDIKATQEHLNAAYDAFTAKYGLLNDRKNGRLFEQDSSYYLLCSLENLDEQGQLKSKAAMFTKRTIRPESTVTSVDTPSEALAVSIGEHGKVDLPYMAELLGTPDEYGRITTELSGVIFKDPAADPTDPEAGWQTADEYLSGNVRDKLRMAQLAAESHPEFKVNVDALTKAQPKDLEASEIDVRLGATWLDPSIVQQFMINSCEKRDSADAVVVRNAIVPLGKDSKCH